MKNQPGRCKLCDGEFDSSKMAKHLPECIEDYRRDLEMGEGESMPPRAYLVAIQSARAPMYWLQVLVRNDASLGQLDSFLRDVWMEGRAHESRFVVGQDVYASEVTTPEAPGELHSDMSAPVSEVLDGEDPFNYVYDLEATTELIARIVASAHMLSDRPDTPIRLLARNRAPDIPCRCGNEASYYCPTCAGSPEGLLCEDCRSDHACARPGQYPKLTNSPRALSQ